MTNTTIFNATSAAHGHSYGFTIRTEKEGDTDVIGEVYTHDGYLLRSLRLPPSPIILDIGAHIGTFSVLAKQCFPDALVYAFEPNERSFELLQANTGPFGVMCINAAVSYTQGTILTDGIGATGGGFMTNRDNFERMAAGKTEADGFIYHVEYDDVETLTIEDIALRYGLDHVDFVKWDCEGGEVDCFRHMSEAATQLFRGPMAGEYHINGGNYAAFEAIAAPRFPSHRFMGGSEINQKRPIGAFFADYIGG